MGLFLASEPFLEWASVTFQILGPHVESREFHETLGVEPTFVRKGVWCFETKGAVSSSDVNQHLSYVLRAFLPITDKIEHLGPDFRVVVSIYWGATDLHSGSGPTIHSESILG